MAPSPPRSFPAAASGDGPGAALPRWGDEASGGSSPRRSVFGRLAPLSIGLLALLGSLLLAASGGVRTPRTHDEFGYLLAADTFLHGRLTNPSPRPAAPFESEHILVRPTYQAKYPPAQGLWLALGSRLGGHPIVGVWLGVAAACAATCWMLMAWMPVRWAWIGGLLAIDRLVFLGDGARWSQSYWGGGVAALGGALLLGAWARLERGPCRRRDGIWLAAGLLLLANSRPFEGLLLALPVLALLGRDAQRRGLRRLRAAGVTAALLLVAGGAWMGWYNFRVTGSAWRLPHLEYQRQYTPSPQFLWLGAAPRPVYSDSELARHFEADLEHYRSLRSASSLSRELGARGRDLASFFYGLPFGLALVALPWSLTRTTTRRALLPLVCVLAGLASLTWFFSHYAAPAAALFVLVLVECLRTIWRWRPGGRAAGRAFATTLAVIGALQTAAFVWTYAPDAGALERRAAIQAELEKRGGRHLVLVRYEPEHDHHVEWVFNGAELDEQPVVWARDLGEPSDRELISAFAARTVWSVDADTGALTRR